MALGLQNLQFFFINVRALSTQPIEVLTFVEDVVKIEQSGMQSDNSKTLASHLS